MSKIKMFHMNNSDDSDNLIIMAANLARNAHDGQTRKHSGDPYYFHVARVAGRVATHQHATEAMVAAAYLHDVLEDTDMSIGEMTNRMGSEVTLLVLQLTNPSKCMQGPGHKRPEKKSVDRIHLAKMSIEAKIIKFIDRIDNLRELGGTEKYKDMYKMESELLADAMGDIDNELRKELYGLCGVIKTL